MGDPDCARLALLLAVGLAPPPLLAQNPPTGPRILGVIAFDAAYRRAFPETERSPAVDGRIDDPIWSHAAVAGDLATANGRRPREETEIRVLVKEGTLYVAFLCRASRPDDIKPDPSAGGVSPADDRVEIEVDPQRNGRIWRFVVSASGATDARRAGESSAQPAPSIPWSAATGRSPGGWTAEVAIPLAGLDSRGDQTGFGIDFVRHHPGSAETSRWAGFSRPGAAGLLAALPGGGDSPDPTATGATVQGPRELRGTVTDSTGGVIIGALVELTGSNEPLVAYTDERGAYRFSGLTPRDYALNVSLAGFVPVTQQVSLTSRQQLSLDIVLQVLVTAEVDVVAGADQLQSLQSLSVRCL